RLSGTVSHPGRTGGWLGGRLAPPTFNGRLAPPTFKWSNDAVPRGPCDEVEQHPYGLRQRNLLADAFDGARGRQPAAIEEPERILKAAPVAGRHARAPQSNHVDRPRGSRLAVDEHVGRDVGSELGHAADVGARADPCERHHAGETADGRAVADLTVAGDTGIVDDDDAVAQAAVVRDVA